MSLFLPDALLQLLHDETISDICINGYHQVVFCRQNNFILCTEKIFTSDENLFHWALTLLNAMNKIWSAEYPFIDGIWTHAQRKYRVHLCFPPVTQNKVYISIRAPSVSRTKEKTPSATFYHEHRWHNPHAPHLGYAFLVRQVQAKQSILIAGSTGSGKTSLISDLIEECDPYERVIALEDVPEISVDKPNFIALSTRTTSPDGYGLITPAQLLRESLRMRPDRIILGECRGNEVLEYLQALNTGHPGALMSIHASSGIEAIKRIELLCQMHHAQLPLPAIRSLIALGLQWVVNLKRSPIGTIQSVYKVAGLEEDTILLRPVIDLDLCPPLYP